MKLQNFMVLFVIIVLPIIIVTAYYMSLQIDTINMQTAYNTKLLESTKEAIKAYEINTVEWNSKFSKTTDSKRRDIMASINTFTTSMANNLGIGGTNKETILTYVPAIAYTLYDGYYIYTPAETKETIKTENETAVIMSKGIWDVCEEKSGTYNSEDDGKVLYKAKQNKQGTYNGVPFTLNSNDAETEYKHILKPFSSYSKQYKGEVDGKDVNVIVNYTLDNYIKIYGQIETKEDDEGNDVYEYVAKSGYLTNLEKFNNMPSGTVEGIKFSGKDIEPELLTEQIAYENESGNMVTEPFNYIYDMDNMKVYIDNSGQCFLLDYDNKRVNIDLLSEPLYKKCTIPRKLGQNYSYIEIYQNLSDGKWYKKTDRKQSFFEGNLTEIDPTIYGVNADKKYDYSAINYCAESYIFTMWVNTIDWDDVEGRALEISDSNDPEDQQSDFNLERREVIKQTLISNLNQSITSYSSNSAGEYQLPVLSETDWDQILSNVSIVTFLQNLPIGVKYYNNYAIATSTLNNEYVDPNEIYLNVDGDEFYHRPYCDKITNTGMMGYRNLDYVAKTYETDYGTKGYFAHAKEKSDGSLEAAEQCYYCMVQRDLYNEGNLGNAESAYYTALARERYIARRTKLPAEIEPTYWIEAFAVEVDATGNIITNPGEVEKIINGEFVINKEGSKIKDSLNGSAFTKLKKNETRVTYEIKSTRDESAEDLEEYDEPSDIQIDEDCNGVDGKESPYVSSSKINISVLQYNDEGVKVSYSGVQNADYGTRTETGYRPLNGELFSIDGNGSIVVKLKYTPNYNVNNPRIINTYSIINDYNDLTIVTKTEGISGIVRLRLKNGSTMYYTNKIRIAEGAELKCRIPNDKTWYDNDWTVEVVNSDLEILATNSGINEYYKIENANGLSGFADAVNEASKTKGRVFRLVNNISNVKMNPIGITDATAFEGKFYSYSGATDLTISNIEINPNSSTYTYRDGTGSTEYQYFGLFGKIGPDADICKLTINSININLTGITSPKRDYKVGGFVGTTSEEIKNVTVNNSTIEGKGYVGGIVGYFDNKMTNCIVENSTIGSGDVTFGSSSTQFSIGSWHVENTNKYCVGGLVGYLGDNSSIANKASTNILKECSISNDSTVKGGEVKYKDGSNERQDSKAAIFAGGVIGYNEGITSIGSDLQTSCNVFGHDNVGGIIGYNEAATTIQYLDHTGSLSGTGENIGGIVGTNTGGNISNCNNNSAITGSGKNVGGIVGLNNAGDRVISNCYNNANIIGDKNVGGIAGITYAGWIDSCGNYNKIEGKDNENYTVGNWYFTAKENCTGTGGIVGKLYQATISKSFNNGEISCNFNGGGLTGLIYGGTIKYSYNSGTVTNQSSSQTSNRLGGIAGAGNSVSILCCYNKGTINGKQDINVLSNGLGGIIGTVVDNSYFLGTEEIAPISKYTEFTLPVLVIKETRNSISSCYNSGAITGGVPYEYTGKFILWDVEVDNRLCHSGGIVGCVLWAPNSNNIQLTDNCYINNVEMGASDSWSNEITSGVSKKTSTEMKDKLNLWASSNPIYVENISGKHVYNTTHPFRKDLGYDGYGILWWQFETCTVNFTITKKQNSTNNYNPVFVTAPTVAITSPTGENVQATNCISYTTPVRSSDGEKYTFTLTAPKGVDFKVNVAEGRDYYTYNGSTYALSNDNVQNKQIELTSKEIYKVKAKVYGYESTEYTSNPIDITGNGSIELNSKRTSTGETTTKTGAANSTTIDVYAGEQVSARVTNTIAGYGSCTTQTFDIPDNATWNASEKVYYITTKMYARQVNLQVNVYGPSNSQVKNIKKEDVVINVTTPYRNSQTLTVEWPGNGQNIAICYGSSVTVKAKAQHYDNSSGTNYGEQTATASNITSDKTINLSLTPHVYSVNNYTPSSTASATVKGGLFNSIRSQWTTIGSGTRTERLRKGSGAQTGTSAEVHGSYDATLTFNATRPSIPEGMSIKNCSIHVKFNIVGLYINGTSSPNLYSNDLHLYFNDTYKSNRMTADDYTELEIYRGDWPNQMVLKFDGKASLNTTETYGKVYEFWVEYTYSY